MHLPIHYFFSRDTKKLSWEFLVLVMHKVSRNSFEHIYSEFWYTPIEVTGFVWWCTFSPTAAHQAYLLVKEVRPGSFVFLLFYSHSAYLVTSTLSNHSSKPFMTTDCFLRNFTGFHSTASLHVRSMINRKYDNNWLFFQKPMDQTPS